MPKAIKPLEDPDYMEGYQWTPDDTKAKLELDRLQKRDVGKREFLQKVVKLSMQKVACEQAAVLIRQVFESGLDSKDVPFLDDYDMPALRRMYAAAQAASEGAGSKKQGDWTLLTVNPPEDDLLALVEATEQFCSDERWSDSAVWCYEQRSDGSKDWYGFHVHILFNRRPAHCKDKVRPDRITDAVLKIFNFPKTIGGRNFKGSQAQKAAINLRHITVDTEDRVYRYLCGDKIDGYKEKPVEQNVLWRKACELDDIYGNAEIFEREEDHVSEEDSSEEEVHREVHFSKVDEVWTPIIDEEVQSQEVQSQEVQSQEVQSQEVL